MKEDWNAANRSNRQKQCKKPKYRTRKVFSYAFSTSFCFVLLLTICLLTSNFSQSVDNGQPNISLLTDDVIATDFKLSKGSDTQGYGFEAAPYNDESWYLILVNRWNPIPDDYEVELIELSNGQSVDTRIYSALQEMFNAARGDGVYPVVISGYRTAEKQQSLMDNKIAEYRALGYSTADAIANAEAWVAIPGTSEHQLGIAVDINADGVNSAGYEVYDWLKENAHKYGFILRYPANKTEITGVINEPWHYRFVGVEAATEIYNQSVCLEEYLNSTS